MVYEYKGVVERVLDEETFASGFKKRSVVVGNDVDSPAKYPNPVMFTFKKERSEKLAGLKKGDRVTIRFAIEGREWSGAKGTRWFVELTGISIAMTDGGTLPADAAPAETAGEPDDSDIPF